VPKPPKKIEPKKQLFQAIEYEIIETIEIGDTKLRLVSPVDSKIKFIQLWSGLSKQWNIMYRYSVDDNWIEWKKIHAGILTRKHENKKTVGRKPAVGKAPSKAKRKPRPKTAPINAKVGGGSRGRKVKD
jgi:hypothetical protein